MAKEHLEYMTAEDVDDLIFSIADLTERIYKLREDFFEREEGEYKNTLRRSLTRLDKKRYDLLGALKQALEGMEV